MLAQYPEVIPEIVVRRRRGLQGPQIATIQQKLTDKAKECLGREMIFELVEYARVPTSSSPLKLWGPCHFRWLIIDGLVWLGVVGGIVGEKGGILS